MSGSMSPIALIFRRKHFKYYHMYDTIDTIITKPACNLAPHQTETTPEGPPSFLPSSSRNSVEKSSEEGKTQVGFLDPLALYATLLYIR